MPSLHERRQEPVSDSTAFSGTTHTCADSVPLPFDPERAQANASLAFSLRIPDTTAQARPSPTYHEAGRSRPQPAKDLTKLT